VSNQLLVTPTFDVDSMSQRIATKDAKTPHWSHSNKQLTSGGRSELSAKKNWD